MLAVTVRFTVKPGCEERFLARVRVQARASLDAEPDCRQFDVCRDVSDARRVFLYEVYTSAAAFAAHLASAHFLAFDADTRAWTDEKVIERWERVEGAG
jgi:quinol monooxygenase YgiN